MTGATVMSTGAVAAVRRLYGLWWTGATADGHALVVTIGATTVVSTTRQNGAQVMDLWYLDGLPVPDGSACTVGTITSGSLTLYYE